MNRGTLINCVDTIDEYVSGTDWRVKANSNASYSNASMINNTSGKVIANYWLDNVYSEEESAAHRNGDYHIHDLDCLTAYCFTGDTKVVLLDGTTPSFKELVDRYKNGEYFWVLSRDKQGNIVPGKAHHPRLIKRDAELIEITISGGAKIVCTPDHEFMLRDGSYRQAKDLRSRESLMPYYSSARGSGYTFVRDAKLGIEEYLHRLVGSWKSGIKDLSGHAVHHINGDKKDNRPENIEVLCDKDHRALELRNTMQSSVWQKANNTRLQEYNRSEEKRSSISKLARQRKRNEKGQFYNHTVVSKKYLDYTEDVYCLTVDEHENFALEAGVFVHNCAGWSLRDLLNEGFNGVRGRVNSRPPKHLRSALSQMANFLGILQNEWAGAQAFTSFDTLLAPYVFKDNMEYNEVEEAIRSFVYNLNVPSRWGQCVPETYKLLLPDGSWVGVHDLKLGDSIMVFDIENETLKEDILTHITFKDAPAKMHRYKAIYSDKVFEVTPDHRVIYADVDGMEPLSIATSQKLLQDKSSVLIPVSATVVEEFTIAEVDSSCNKVWCPTTNTGTFVCMTDRGHVFLTGNCPFTNITFDWTVPNDLKYLQPLCNSLPLFSDIDSLELLQKAQERGVESLEELTYEHMLPEMQIIQKAYYKVMTEGDSTGQPFTFPIPTINITEDFDWESDSADALFENAAKVGSSYFQNFVGTQYKLDEAGNKVIDENAFKPSDLRSMCPLDYNEKIVVRDQHDAIYAPIGEVYQRHVNGVKYKCFYNGEWIPAKAIEVNPQKLYHITLANNSTYKMGAEHEQPILRDGKTMIIPAKEIVAGDLIPFNSTAIDAGMVNSSYALGYAVGAYLNDGSKDKDGIIYSIDDDIAENTLKTFWEGLGYRVTITYNDNRRSLHVGVGAGSFDIIAKYFTGKSAQDRAIAPNILSQSVDMRKGLIDGYIATAGDRDDSRVWTSSHVMVEDLIAVFNSIGVKAYCSFTDTRDGNHYYAISYIKDRENCDGKYTTVDGQLYWTVTDVQVKDNTKPLYCLVTDSDHHLFILKDGLITHNCRLRLNLKEIRKRGNGLFGSGEATGSIGVVTINLARIGYMYRGDKEGLYKHLFKLMDMASSTLTKKRKIVNELYERGMYPYTKRYLKAGFSNHFSTIGVNGANEMVRNFTNDEHDISDEWGKAFCIELLQRMNERIVQYQEDTGNLYNLEASPAESACYRFAREDAARFPGIIQAGTCDQNYYTNSTQLNSGHTADMFIALKHQNELQPLYSGGVVFHLYMGEAVSSPDACKWMMKKIMENFRLPYVTVTPTFSVCEKHGYIKGNHEYCPYCDEEALTQVKSSCACHH